MKQYLLVLAVILSTIQTAKADKVLAATFTIDPTKASIGSMYTLAVNTVTPKVVELEIDFGNGINESFTYSFDGNILSPKFVASTLKGSVVKLYMEDPLDIGLLIASNVNDVEISSLTNLRWLGIYGGSMTQLDVSSLPNLLVLGCVNLKLSSLDVSNNPLLSNLLCYNNELTALDLSSNLFLTDINCEINNISSLLLPPINFNSLICGNNNLVFSDLPPLSTITGTKDYQPQANVQLSASYNISVPIDLSAVGATDITWLPASGNTISSTDLNNSYTVTGGVTTFTSPVGQVFAMMKNPSYLFLTIYSSTINVVEPITTSIDEGESSTKVEGLIGAISLTSDEISSYSVFNTSGIAVANGTLRGETIVAVPQGLYVVKLGNISKKVIVK